MSQPNSHTHCQVTPADPQAKTWQRVCLFQRTSDRLSIRKIKGQHPTKCICHKGFSDIGRFVARNNGGAARQESNPQSATFHTRSR